MWGLVLALFISSFFLHKKNINYESSKSIESITERIESLKSELEQTEDINECEVIQERITRLVCW